MKWLKQLSLLALTSLASVAIASPANAPKEIWGKWVVVGNELAPSKVEAYFRNDPSLTGSTLDVGPHDIHWVGHDAWNGLCSSYKIVPDGNRHYKLFCQGQGADDATFDMRVTRDGKSMTMEWFDLLILHLQRR